MESSQSHIELAEALADTFTVYVPDRRGRGMSGPFGDGYSVQKEIEDLDALLTKTDAHSSKGEHLEGEAYQPPQHAHRHRRRCRDRQPCGERRPDRARRSAGWTAALSVGMEPTRCRRSAHDPGRVVRDLIVTIADGGDCLADLSVLREQPDLFGEVASSPTAWRVIDAITPERLGVLRDARRQARERAWAKGAAPERITLDFDATLVTAHSEKEGAADTRGRRIMPCREPVARGQPARQQQVRRNSSRTLEGEAGRSA